MRLYTFFRSSAAYRVRIALNLKGADYEREPKSFAKLEHRAADYLAVNPQGLIPALALDRDVLSQSLAIIEYLDEVYPEPAFLPRDPIDRAKVRSIALAVACDIHPLNNLRVLNYLRGPLKQNDESVGRWYQHWVSEGFTGLETQVQESSADGRYCFGSAVTLADICLVPQMFNARRFKVDVTPFPTLVSICAHLERTPAFIAASPDEQPDAT